MEAKAERDPLKNVSIQADAAGQIGFALPMNQTVTNGTDRYELQDSSPILSSKYKTGIVN